MKKVLSLLLCIFLCLTFAACSQPQDLQGEQCSELSFIIGEKQKCVLGDEFIIFSKDAIPVKINTSIVAYHECDINNINDYQRNQSQFYKYIYKGEITGNVDKSYAGRKIYIIMDYSWNVQSDNDCPRPSDGIIIDPDGNFTISFRVFSHSNSISYSIREVYIR